VALTAGAPSTVNRSGSRERRSLARSGARVTVHDKAGDHASSGQDR